MYDPKKIIDISNALIKGYSEKYDKFIDERRTEWARRVDEKFRPKPIDDDFLYSGANKRLELYREIVKNNEYYCRRDIEIPNLEFEQQLKRIREFKRSREEAGLTEPFPGLLAEEANIYMLKRDFSKAFDCFSEAIRINAQYSELIVKRDNVRYLAKQVRCLYMTREFDKALELAEKARLWASQIDPDMEEADWNNGAAVPGLQFVPINVHAYFAACDARVHHADWESNDQLRREFSGLWGDAVTKYNVPRVWRTPMKIAVVSDPAWVARTESYVHDIAQHLYVELGGGQASRVLRLVRTRWGGFGIVYPKSVAASLTLIVFFAAADVNTSYARDDYIGIASSYIQEESLGITTEQFAEAFSDHIPEFSRMAPSELLKSQAQPIEVADLQLYEADSVRGMNSTLKHFLDGGESEGSVHRI